MDGFAHQAATPGSTGQHVTRVTPWFYPESILTTWTRLEDNPTMRRVSRLDVVRCPVVGVRQRKVARNARSGRACRSEFAHMFGFSGAVAPENPNVYDSATLPGRAECDIRGYMRQNGLACATCRDAN